jgi:hypothetical protein
MWRTYIPNQQWHGRGSASFVFTIMVRQTVAKYLFSSEYSCVGGNSVSANSPVWPRDWAANGRSMTLFSADKKVS